MRLPQGFAPFNVTEIGNNVFVTYAKQDKAKQMDVPGRGNGFVDEFTNSGAFIKRFASDNEFNSPWGLTIAPASFGRFSNDLLVGKFGDGTIHAFNPTTARLLDALTTSDLRQLVIPGLWEFAPRRRVHRRTERGVVQRRTEWRTARPPRHLTAN